MNQEPIIIERTFNASVARVWQAVTNKTKMSAWSFNITEFEPQVGFEFTFYGENEGRTFLHRCVVLEVVENKKLRYSWRYDNYPGDSIVTYELFDEGEQTRFKLTHEGLETFPKDNPDFSKGNFNMGWTQLIGQLLKDYVEKV